MSSTKDPMIGNKLLSSLRVVDLKVCTECNTYFKYMFMFIHYTHLAKIPYLHL